MLRLFALLIVVLLLIGGLSYWQSGASGLAGIPRQLPAVAQGDPDGRLPPRDLAFLLSDVPTRGFEIQGPIMAILLDELRRLPEAQQVQSSSVTGV